MRPIIPGLTVLAAALAVVGADAAPQARGGSSNPASAVLTVDEIRKITGFPGYSEPDPGDPPGQGVGGGASCQYQSRFENVGGKEVIPLPGPLLSVVLIKGKNYTQSLTIGAGCKTEAVPGVGDAAFFEVCPAAKLSRTPPLYVKSGAADLVLQMDIGPPDTYASLRPKLIALARAASARVK